jgi:hypothetical protein
MDRRTLTAGHAGAIELPLAALPSNDRLSRLANFFCTSFKLRCHYSSVRKRRKEAKIYAKLGCWVIRYFTEVSVCELFLSASNELFLIEK